MLSFPYTQHTQNSFYDKVNRSQYREQLLTHDFVFLCKESEFLDVYKCSVCGYEINTTYTSVVHYRSYTYRSYTPELTYTMVGSETCQERIMKRALE